MKHYIYDVFWIQLCYFHFTQLIIVLTKNVSHSLFVKQFCFSIFYKTFFYTYLAIAFAFSSVVRDQTVAFCCSSLERSWYLLQAFFFQTFLCCCFFLWCLADESLDIFIYEKWFYINVKKWFFTFSCVFTINTLCSLHNSNDYESLKKYLESFEATKSTLKIIFLTLR